MRLDKPQLYRHYKNKLYSYFDTVKHSETMEDLVLYKPLADNPEDQLWVRPKDMFFEKIEVEGKKKLRFEPISFQFLSFKDPDQKTKQDLILLSQSIFPKFESMKLDTRLIDKKNILVLAAIDNSISENAKLVGFKIGYELNHEIYYSWLGGVDPKYRQLGLGQELLKLQHEWCETMGYKYIETKTQNRWKKMLLLNLKNGFDIVGTEVNANQDLKILMRKKFDLI